MLADQPRQLHEVDRRDQPDIDLGIAEGRGIAGNDHVAGDGNGHAAGADGAIDRGDGRLAHAVLGVVEGEVEFFEKLLGLDTGLAPDDVEIEPGAKHLMRAADDHGADGIVVARFRECRKQRVDQGHAQRIDGCAVQHDLGDAAGNGIANQIRTHAPPPVA
jgi:hypothetical protein